MSDKKQTSKRPKKQIEWSQFLAMFSNIKAAIVAIIGIGIPAVVSKTSNLLPPIPSANELLLWAILLSAMPIIIVYLSTAFLTIDTQQQNTKAQRWVAALGIIAVLGASFFCTCYFNVYNDFVVEQGPLDSPPAALQKVRKKVIIGDEYIPAVRKYLIPKLIKMGVSISPKRLLRSAKSDPYKIWTTKSIRSITNRLRLFFLLFFVFLSSSICLFVLREVLLKFEYEAVTSPTPQQSTKLEEKVRPPN